MKYPKHEIERSKEVLRDLIKPDTKLLVNITSVSRSGMSRRMKILDQQFNDITYYVARATERPQNDRGLQIGGCGMDMAFALMDELTWALYDHNKPEWLKGNGGSCIDWRTTY